MGETAFVTGGSGFIGGRLIERLVAEGWSVRALARSDAAHARVEALGAEAVRGVRIRNEDLDVEAWLEALASDLREQAQTSAEARAALERLLR